jgi:hypothetical protein
MTHRPRRDKFPVDWLRVSRQKASVARQLSAAHGLGMLLSVPVGINQLSLDALRGDGCRFVAGNLLPANSFPILISGV